MNRTEINIASIGLIIGTVFGISGSIFTEPAVLQIILYEISSLALVSSTTFLGIKFLREKKDFIATGFFLFAIGEAVMTSGMPLGQIGGQPAFGAGIALYVPALLFISIPKVFPLVVRFTGLAACIPFTIVSAKIFLGQQVLSTEPLPGAGYGLLSLTLLGLAISFWRKEKFMNHQFSEASISQ